MSTISNVETKIVEVEAKIVEVEAEIMKVKAELTTCSESEEKKHLRDYLNRLLDNLNLLRKKEEQLRNEKMLLLESTSRTTGIFPR